MIFAPVAAPQEVDKGCGTAKATLTKPEQLPHHRSRVRHRESCVTASQNCLGSYFPLATIPLVTKRSFFFLDL